MLLLYKIFNAIKNNFIDNLWTKLLCIGLLYYEIILIVIQILVKAIIYFKILYYK